MMRRKHRERHRHGRSGWLRAAVLGANDGIVSTASLLVGIAASGASRPTLLLAGLAALVGGAMSMAAGEYVSVSSQADTERADLAKEREELAAPGDHERQELAQIYVGRGLDIDLADEVARQLMDHDALGAHARDELGIHEIAVARPVQAALTSAAAFATGAALPLAAVALLPTRQITFWLAATTLVCLVALGMLAARVGGAPLLPAALRVTFWGVAAMAATALVGHWFGPMVV
jgi:vacuolar iron transporter family protein